MSRTKEVFDVFRRTIGAARPIRQGMVKNNDELRQMTIQDGLLHWQDGQATGAPSKDIPPIRDAQLEYRHLWVVTENEVLYAQERCAFGTTLESRMIKHSNLTGGGSAYSGGELIFAGENEVVVNGRSGRYGPTSAAEMRSVAKAFKESGYHVWSMGFDEETARPYGFIGKFPEWIG